MLKIKFCISGIQVELNVHYFYLLKMKNIPFWYIPRKALDNISPSNWGKKWKCQDKNPPLDSSCVIAYDAFLKQTMHCIWASLLLRLLNTTGLIS